MPPVLFGCFYVYILCWPPSLMERVMTMPWLLVVLLVSVLNRIHEEQARFH